MHQASPDDCLIRVSSRVEFHSSFSSPLTELNTTIVPEPHCDSVIRKRNTDKRSTTKRLGHNERDSDLYLM